MHYACENLYDAKDRPAAVSCIAVANVKEGSSVAFSLADEPGDVAVEERETSLLRRFYRYLSEHRDARVLHWNMNSSTFGFSALSLRYSYLTRQEPPYQPPAHLLCDLDGVIGALYGEVYVPHPKLYSIATLNKLGIRSFLQGREEARRFAEKDFGVIRASTSAKARVIATLFLRLCDGSLQTQTSVGSVEFAGERLDAVGTVLALGDRFLYVRRSLAKRFSNRPTILVKDEHDAQDLLRSLLLVFFDDVRPESWTPNYAGGSSRVDFLLPDFRVAIELKHSRDSMTSKSLADELIVDRDRYQGLGDVSHLICLVFDYDGYLDGPRGLERDLSRQSSTEGLAVTVKIYDR